MKTDNKRKAGILYRSFGEGGNMTHTKSVIGEKEKMNPIAIKKRQAQLNKAGHSIKVDGISGPKTQAAMAIEKAKGGSLGGCKCGGMMKNTH